MSLTIRPTPFFLDRHGGNSVYEAISMGHPERMDIQHGWSVETFLEKSTTRLASGCDRFHEEVLMREPAGLVQLER